jgi:MarR-like DNA-binding transcriptional regulator SgrR of sgrS sRNA
LLRTTAYGPVPTGIEEKWFMVPVGTGPYAVVRNNQNQLKIHAFEDYFGYRALIDEVYCPAASGRRWALR